MDLDPLTVPDLFPPSSMGLFSSRTESLLRVPTPPPVPRLVPSSASRRGVSPQTSRPRSSTLPASLPPAAAVDCTATVESPRVLGAWSAGRGPALEIVISLRCNHAWVAALAALALVMLVASLVVVIRIA